MKRLTILSLVALAACLGALPAAAGDFDGSKPLLCSMISVAECTHDGKCNSATPEDVSLPQFLRVDLASKVVTPAGSGAGERKSEIKFLDRRGGYVVLQGADAGPEEQKRSRGWTAALSEETGKLVVTVAAEDAGFVIFGACLPL